MAGKQFSLKAILSITDRYSRQLARFNRMLAAPRKQFARLTTGAQNLAGALARIGPIGAIFGAGGVAAIGTAAGKIISVSAEFERLGVVLETVLGSSEKAREALAWVEKFAAETPYELQEVSEAFVRLNAYGIDATNGSLRAAGDAAAAMGKGMMQAVEALADAMTGENERLKEFGIRASVAGDEITYRWRENGKDMEATALKTNRSMIQNIITGIWNRNYGGAMDKLSGTWAGMWSNMQDTFTRAIKAVGDAGFFSWMKEQLRGLLDAFRRMEADGTLRRIAESISRAFVEMGEAVKSFVMRVDWHGMIESARDLGRAIGDLVDKIGGPKGLVIALGAIVAAPVVGALGQITTAALGLGAAIGPVGWTIAGIAAAAYAIIENWEPIKAFFADLWDEPAATLQRFAAAIIDLLAGPEMARKLTAPYDEFVAAIDDLWPRARAGIDTFVREASVALDIDLLGPWQALVGAIERLWPDARAGIETFVRQVMLALNPIQRLIDAFKRVRLAIVGEEAPTKQVVQPPTETESLRRFRERFGRAGGGVGEQIKEQSDHLDVEPVGRPSRSVVEPLEQDRPSRSAVEPLEQDRPSRSAVEPLVLSMPAASPLVMPAGVAPQGKLEVSFENAPQGLRVRQVGRTRGLDLDVDVNTGPRDLAAGFA